MKRLLLLLLATSCVGCFAAQRDAINEDADRHLHTLDAECKEHMTDWCIVQYNIVQQNRDNALTDLAARRAQAAHILSHMGDGFQRQAPTNIRCITNTYSGMAYTTCSP